MFYLSYIQRACSFQRRRLSFILNFKTFMKYTKECVYIDVYRERSHNRKVYSSDRVGNKK